MELLKAGSAVELLNRSRMRELERLEVNIDRVEYMVDTGGAITTTTAVFKYYFLFQWVDRWWTEVNILIRIPPHPNIIAFQRLVVDDNTRQVIGFTIRYISGGTVQENKSRVFKLIWLVQLMSVIDLLNLRYGLLHGDIAARNLLVDSDNLVLFDFNWSRKIGTSGRGPQRDDVALVAYTMYEIITRDEELRNQNWQQPDPADVLDLRDWVKHPDVNLEHPIAAYRSLLESWVAHRQAGPKYAKYTDAPEYIDWPDLKEAAGAALTQSKARHEMKQKGEAYVEWERPPPSRKVGVGHQVLNARASTSGEESKGEVDGEEMKLVRPADSLGLKRPATSPAEDASKGSKR